MRQTKLLGGGIKTSCSITEFGDRIFIKSRGFNRALNEHIKALDRQHYVQYQGSAADKRFATEAFGGVKGVWSLPKTPHNLFQLDYLEMKNPYRFWQTPVSNFEYQRPLRDYQIDASDFMLSRHRGCILAGDPGIGKTLPIIEVTEHMPGNWWYVSSKSACHSVRRELEKWKAQIRPFMMTYQALVQMLEAHEGEALPVIPEGIIFDEAHALKNPKSKRSQAADFIVQVMRETCSHASVILASGTVAPLNPGDWWHQCQVAAPGFLREGTLNKFRMRLAFMESQKSAAGYDYLKIIDWKDDPQKCAECGKSRQDHEDDLFGTDFDHPWKESKNEVAFLAERTKGLVLVQRKKDLLGLPDIMFEHLPVEPSKKVLNIARGILKRAKRGAQAAIDLRELSDGFQYKKVPKGEQTCPKCDGAKQVTDWIIKPDFGGVAPPAEPDETDDEWQARTHDEVFGDCGTCKGHGVIPKWGRKVIRVDCPKDELVEELLDRYSETGRFIAVAGFQGSIDRVCDVVKSCGWEYIRMDGRGLLCSFEYDGDPLDLMDLSFGTMGDSKITHDTLRRQFPKVCFVGNPDACGEGLTLTASPAMLVYSCSNNGKSMQQVFNRGHRLGMDVERGFTIYFAFHLPTDQKMYESTREKGNLQNLTLGDLQECMPSSTEDEND